MNLEEKTKLKIQMLQSQSDYHKFEYSQFSTYFLGLIALIISIYLPIVSVINNIKYIVILWICLLISIGVIKKFFQKRLNQSAKKIEKTSREIHSLYNKLINK